MTNPTATKRALPAVALLALLAACGGSKARYVDAVRAGPHPGDPTDEELIGVGEVHCQELHEWAARGSGDNRDSASVILHDLKMGLLDWGATEAEAEHLLASAVVHLCPDYEYGLDMWRD